MLFGTTMILWRVFPGKSTFIYSGAFSATCVTGRCRYGRRQQDTREGLHCFKVKPVNSFFTLINNGASICCPYIGTITSVVLAVTGCHICGTSSPPLANLCPRVDILVRISASAAVGAGHPHCLSQCRKSFQDFEETMDVFLVT